MSKLTLDSVDWGEFYFSEIFNNIYIAQSTDLNKLDTGETVFIGRRSDNNGLQDFVNIDPKKIINKNCITVSMVGEPRAFYQQYDFTCSQNILILRNDKYLNKSIAMYLCSIINNYLMDKGYGYGYPVGLKRVLRNKIILPIDSNNAPNWQFMEDYIKQEMKVQSSKVASYYKNKLMKLGFELLDYNVEWKEFKVKDLFEVKPVKGKSITHYKVGKIPYITTSSVDNGLNNFIDTEENISLKNCISIDPIGGKSFFHEYDFVGRGGAGSAINLLYNNSLDKYSGLFICKLLESSSISKASYGIQLNGNRLKNLKLLIPIDKNGEPHWKYMSNFVKKLEKENIKKTLNHIYIYIYIYI